MLFLHDMKFLKMREYRKLVVIPSMLDEFVAHELAGREEQIHARGIRPEPPVEVSFHGQSDPRRESRITARRQRMPEAPTFTLLAGLALIHQVVAGTQQLKIVQVVQH